MHSQCFFVITAGSWRLCLKLAGNLRSRSPWQIHAALKGGNKPEAGIIAQLGSVDAAPLSYW